MMGLETSTVPLADTERPCPVPDSMAAELSVVVADEEPAALLRCAARTLAPTSRALLLEPLLRLEELCLASCNRIREFPVGMLWVTNRGEEGVTCCDTDVVWLCNCHTAPTTYRRANATAWSTVFASLYQPIHGHNLGQGKVDNVSFLVWVATFGSS